MTNSVAYGFIGLEHLFSERVTEVGVERVWDALQQSMTEYNREINALLGSTVERTTEHQRRVMLPGTGTLQPTDEWAIPQPVAPSGYYDVGYPIKGGSTAWGLNRITSQLITVEEANRNTLDAQQRDMDWLRRHLLASLLYSSSWTFDDKQYGDLTVMPLANNDTVTYVKRGAGNVATDNHYLAQAAAIDATHDPFPTIYSELTEHPVNDGPYVVYCASDLTSSITALSDFEEVTDPVIRYGADSDVIDVSNEFDDTIRGFGDTVLGRKSRMWIVEWAALPSGYMLAHARGTRVPLVRMREYPAANLQGFYTIEHDPRGLLNTQFSMFRDCGFGVHNRVGAVAYYVGGASYTNPTGYTSIPLAV